MITFGVVATKGGVGKTTIAANLGGLLADIGYRVLLVDADVQPSLSRYFEVAHEAEHGLTKMVMDGVLTAECVSTIELPPGSFPGDQDRLNKQGGALHIVRSDTDPVVQPLAQTPLPGMLASVPRRAAPELPVAPEAPTSRTSGPSKDAQATIKEHLAEINNIVPLYDVLFSVPEMPFGYLIDLPEQDIAHAGNPQVTPVAPHLIPLRHATWKLLAILSYQFDARCLAAIPPQNAREMHWTTAYQQGNSAFEQACAARAGFYLQGDAFAMGMTEFQLVLGTPALGYSFIKLLGAMEQLRLDHPDRFPVGFEPLFPTTA